MSWIITFAIAVTEETTKMYCWSVTCVNFIVVMSTVTIAFAIFSLMDNGTAKTVNKL